MRASRRVRFLCSRPFFTSRRTMSASVERSTPVCSTRPVWLMSGFCATQISTAYWRGVRSAFAASLVNSTSAH